MEKHYLNKLTQEDIIDTRVTLNQSWGRRINVSNLHIKCAHIFFKHKFMYLQLVEKHILNRTDRTSIYMHAFSMNYFYFRNEKLISLYALITILMGHMKVSSHFYPIHLFQPILLQRPLQTFFQKFCFALKHEQIAKFEPEFLK